LGEGRALRVVVLDASVLLNFLSLGQVDLLTRLDGLTFVVPAEVAEEITRPEQRRQLDEATSGAQIGAAVLDRPEELELRNDLQRVMGRGEAACLALATARGWLVACDEKRAFRRRATALLGERRLFTTPGLLLLAIRQGLIAVDQADEIKLLLERHRFKMAFRSFRDLVGEEH
jgi:predicted nucleic acid-binding protein